MPAKGQRNSRQEGTDGRKEQPAEGNSRQEGTAGRKEQPAGRNSRQEERNSIKKRGQAEWPALPSFAEEWLEELSGKK